MDYEEKLREIINSKCEYYPSEDKAVFAKYFPELKESEDERIRKALKQGFFEYGNSFTTFGGIQVGDILAWLEKQGNKSVNIDVESMISSYEQRLESQGGTKYTPLVNMCLTAFRHGVENVLEELNLKKLEKQGEHKPFDYENANIQQKDFALKVEPKFNFEAGQWIVATGKCVYLITKIDEFTVALVDVMGNEYEFSTDSLNDATLWTIQDAKDGDVLTSKGKGGQEVGIVKRFIGKYGGYNNCFETYCYSDLDGTFRTGEYMGGNTIHPAVKKQRELLFSKMKETGYEWDSEKKELKKIEVVSKESEDERIRKTIYGWIYTQPSRFFDNGFSKEEMLAWLEKQCEHKPFDYENANIQQKDFALKVEPKFKVGDKVTVKGDNTIYTIGIIAPDKTCWLKHGSREYGWATFGVLKHYVE